MKRYLKWLFCLCLILLFFLIIFVVIKDNNLVFDTFIYNKIIRIKSDFFTIFFKGITFLASVPFMVFITVLVLFFKINKKYKFIIALNMINDVILNNFIKFIFKRQRPVDWFLVNESGYSFPSGHTMAAVCFYGLLIYLIYRSKLNKKCKVILISLLTLLIIGIGISRIYLGVHYASDVIGGVVIALIYLIIYTTIIGAKILNKKNT